RTPWSAVSVRRRVPRRGGRCRLAGKRPKSPRSRNLPTPAKRFRATPLPIDLRQTSHPPSRVLGVSERVHARSSDVQCGHRVAFRGTAEMQYGHSFVVGEAAGSGFLVKRLTWRIKRKMAKATMRKSMTVLRNSPTFKVGAPAALAAANEAYDSPFSARKRLEKSTLPSARPSGGIMMSATKDETIFPNAAPMMMPTAMSRTLPRMAKSRNSFSMVDLPPPSVGLYDVSGENPIGVRRSSVGFLQ